ncbi:hypothetical protein ACVDG5_006920 [Mesorhizobium sp. ORM6]
MDNSDVAKIIRSAIKQLLELGVNYRLHQYLFKRHSRDWRDLTQELHVEYPVKAIGIIANPKNIEKYHFVHGEEDVLPDDIVHMVGDNLYDAALASYAFTILEICGDDVISALDPAAKEERKAWHLAISQNEDMSEGEAKGLQIRFAKLFAADPAAVLPKSIIRLARMKAARNEFAHQGNSSVDFEQFLEDALAVLCQIFFICFPDKKVLKVYPWEVLYEKWEKGNYEYMVNP